MLKRDFVVVSLGVMLAFGVAHQSFALTPEEEAALRQEAKALTEQARVLQSQADDARESALGNFFFALSNAGGLEDQAHARDVGALQKWLQVGADREARASSFWESGRSLLLSAYQYDVLVAVNDLLADSERVRVGQQRGAAQALLASGTDKETVAAAKELDRQADKDAREALALERHAAQLRDQSAQRKERAADLLEKAIALEAMP